ncbi:hypothetical protein Glove_50g138 [Diversispora epigaea]|uniref:Uncharacterized protein n=1 Tax=Diversispora epigaea TaxID=1348612 RepID=A0A397JDW0_9GLOM|nr:hypothetical protein Glove_50g138 [Diversispora epigaea]
MLTIYDYNDNIIERKEEHSMKGLQLVGFEEQHLHFVFDYINALKIILSINNRTQHLRGFVALVVINWPGQLFIKKALCIQTLNSSQEINSFLPMLGPLHVSLNSREQVMLIHHSFFEKLFYFVFGKNKKLAKKSRSWRINLLLELAKCGLLKIKNRVIKKFGKVYKDIEYQTAIDLFDNLIPAVIDIYATLFRSGLFEEYVKTIFRIWTFALRWKRKNYNKASLVFLSDLFYWKDNDHPFFNALQKHLSCFNNYYVENTYSKIRVNTLPNAIVDNIIKQAYVITVIDIYATLFRSGLFEEYVKTIFRIWTFALRWKRKNYNKASLVFLSDLFYWKDNDHPFFNALQKHLSCFNNYYVENTYSKIRVNTLPNAIVDNIIKQAYVIIILGEEVDLRHLPTGYNTSYPSIQELCNRCKLLFVNEDSIIFICGHGYHTNCYDKKRAEILTQEDFDDNENNIKEEEEQFKKVEIQKISNRVEIKIHQIENW